MYRKLLFAVALLLLGLAMASCAAQPAAEGTPCPEAPACPECEACPEAPAVAVPFEDAWAGSGHADAEAEAFNHWNEEDPAEIPVECAKCHATPGYLDFLGEDGSAAGTVDAAAELGTVITCEACHNAAAASMTSVVFPSGVEITDIGSSARCMQCHQGRASGQSVNDAIAELGLTDEDAPSADLGFINIHYYAAAASLYGSEVHAGYEYEGNRYQIRFSHVEGFTECADCHNTHTLEVKVETCAECHGEVASEDDLKNFRMAGSLADYDGDGDTSEGVYYEIVGLQEMLYAAIQAYAAETAGTPLVYNSAAYPYFFIDTNSDGEAGEDESVFPNAYNAWTPRLLKAAYNYQVSLKDPGAFAHNAKYHIALLYDSIADLNTALATPVDLSAASRNDPGHFDGTAEAFRHWDAEEPPVVPGRCARCHSADGIEVFEREGVNISAKPANSFACVTCHTFGEEGVGVRTVDEVTFPSGAALTFGEGANANLCMLCHQGRESTASVDRAIGGAPADAVAEGLSFRNVHYFAAGSTLFGTEAKGAYEFAGKTYLGRNLHVEGFNTCVDCHEVHALEVEVEACAACHGGEDVDLYRIDPTDWDGDTDTTEGLIGEIETVHEALYAAIQAYAASNASTDAIVYDAHAYPYWFIDTNEDGVTDPDEVNYENSYKTWTPNLLRAAYNYQYAAKDPGAFAHNGKYVLQILIDSVQAVGGDAAAFTRP